MTDYQYLIIGGGMTAAAAVDGIREVDPAGSIGLIGAETEAPYDRPPLSKALWKGAKLETIWRPLAGKRVKIHPGCPATEILPKLKRVLDAKGNIYNYDKLLLAMGGRPRRLPFGDEHIIYFRSFADYRRLRQLTETGQRFAVIGGGFIGAEIAAALALNGKEVVMTFPGQDIGDRIFPRELAQFVSQYYRQKGIKLLAGEKITGAKKSGGQCVLTTTSGHAIVADGIVAGIGIEPNVEMARFADLKVEDGIVVDEFLRAGWSDVFAAGDLAAFYSVELGKYIRVEHEDNANTMGRLAGQNMAGKSNPYRHLPSFYSDLFDLGYEAVGELDARLETYADWKVPNREGVVYYLQNGRVRGVLLWNVWGKVEAARQLIAEHGCFGPGNLKGRIAG
jgi:NADPH-dependent 2,4-dienoyl-CoA reductase/sulfur reductase-like enzyme